MLGLLPCRDGGIDGFAERVSEFSGLANGAVLVRWQCHSMECGVGVSRGSRSVCDELHNSDCPICNMVDECREDFIVFFDESK